MPHAWQVRFNASGIDPESRIDEPVDPAIVRELLDAHPRLRARLRAGRADDRRVRRVRADRRTLRAFIKSYHDLIGAIRDVVLPDPDVRPARPGPKAR